MQNDIKNQPLNSVITNQREQINALISEKDAQEQILQKMYIKVQKLNEEISLLSRALVSSHKCIKANAIL